MQQLKCLIIEDEPLAAEVLQDYINQVSFLELRAVCTDALYAMEFLQQEKIDIIFLDIHLPRLKGIDFLKTLQQPVQVIITSAYHEYALKSFEFSVVDYLLKPIEFGRFLKAINKIRQPETSSGNSGPVVHSGGRDYLFFNVSKKRVRVFLDEILFIEGLKEYIRIVTAQKTILTKYQISHIEELLVPFNFLRIHRSFIVSREKIDAFTAIGIEIGGKTIPIGRSYKEAVQTSLGIGPV